MSPLNQHTLPPAPSAVPTTTNNHDDDKPTATPQDGSKTELSSLSDNTHPQHLPHDAEKAAPPQIPASDDVPDGGAAAWLVVLGAWCTSFCSFGWLNSVGVFQEYYQSELLSSYSPSTISWIPSLQIFFMMAMGPLVGAIFDRHGVRWLLLVGSLMHVFGIMMTSLGTEYYQILLAQGLCSAIGVSAVFQPSLTCVAGWFSTHRAAALGIVFTGSSVGGVVFPILVSHLVRALGFPWAMRICGFLILALLVLANLLVRPFRPPRPHPVTRAQLAKPFREPAFVLILAGFFLFSYGNFVPFDYLPANVLSAGMSRDLAQYILPILNAGSLFGRLLAGVCADRLGRYNVFIAASYLSGIWILALWLPAPSGNGPLISFAVLFGFFSGAYVSLITPLVMAISPFSELGFRTGIVLCATAVGGLTTNPINGAILDGPAGWAGLKVFSGVFCMAGTTFVLFARVYKTGFKFLTRF